MRILKNARHDLVPPGGGVYELNEEEKRQIDELKTNLSEAYDSSIHDPYDPYDAVKAFGENATASEDDKRAWASWDSLLRKMRLDEWTNFVNRMHFHEDLMYGPSQGNDQYRLWSNGFQRNSDTGGQVLWDYWMSEKDTEDTPQNRSGRMRPAADLMVALSKHGSKLRFRPARKDKDMREMRRLLVRNQLDDDGNPKLDKNDDPVQGGALRYVRNALTGAVEEDDEGFARMETIGELLQQHQQYIRDTKGHIMRDENGVPLLKVRERNVNHSVSRIRLQIISIRLNAHHWEWCYSRHLQNDEMYDTPSMTPYLHNEEFKELLGDARKRAHASGAAVPLLTRGTLGFNGVRMGADALAPIRPTVAIDSVQALSNWTVETLRGLPRIRESTYKVQGGIGGRLQRLDALLTGPDVLLQQPLVGGVVDVLFPGMTREPCWSSVFRYNHDGTNEYYANAYVARADQTWEHCTVKGYDSWVDGRGAAAILASNDAQRADDRLKLTFSGLPIYFGSREATTSNGLTRKGSQCGPFYDVRILVNEMSAASGSRGGGAEGTAATKFYSEVYRELMFAPMPVRHVDTLPAAHAQGVATPKTFRDTSELSWKNTSPDSLTPLQMPKYLNFTTSLQNLNTAHGVARPSTAGSGPQGKATARGANLVPNYSDDSDDDEQKRQGGKNESEDAKEQQLWQKLSDQSLQQHYPEVLLNWRGNWNRDLGRQVLAFFKSDPKKLTEWRTEEGLSWLKKLNTKNQQEALSTNMKSNLQLDHGRDQPIALQLLAPTTLRGAMARYTEEHKYALAYYRKERDGNGNVLTNENGNPKRMPIGTSYKKMQKAGGLYYSCRIDTGTGPNQGGLDTLLPLDMEAGVYDIADIQLARGVHEYVYSPPTKTDDAGNFVQMHTPAFAQRVGPPDWWAWEQANIRENVDATLRGLMDPHPYDKEVKYYDVNNQQYNALTAQWRPPVESIWTDNVIRSPTWNPPLPTPLNGLASMNSMYGLYSGRALYDSSILDANAPDPSQRERFATYQLRRLDTVEGFPERSDLGDPASWRPGQLNPTGPSTLHMALKSRKSLGNAPPPGATALPTVGFSSLLGPTGFHVASEVTRTGIPNEPGWKDWVSGKSPAGRYSTQAVMFDAYYRKAYPPNQLNPTGQEVVNALPHRHDLRVPCMPIYPSRLSMNARKATWRRLSLMRKAQEAGNDPDVVDADRAAAIQEENSAAMSQNPDKYVREDLPEDQEYISRADYGRNGASRKKGYHAARSDAKPRAQRGDESGAFGRTLVVPLYVVALEFDDFKRAVRATDLEWGQFFEAYPNYLRRKDEFKVQRRYKDLEAFVEYLVPDKDYRLPTATFPPRPSGRWSTHDGPWYHDSEATVDAETALETRGVLAEETWSVLERARRPAERTRTSWFSDRKAFGGLENNGNGSVHDAFKARVQRWENMYIDYVKMRDALAQAATAEAEIARHVKALNLHSLRVCWGLSRLNMEKAQPGNLYAQDGAAALLLPRVDLAEQWMRCYDGELPSVPSSNMAMVDPDSLQRFTDAHGICDTLESNQFVDFSKRLPLVIFLMDLVDDLTGARDEIAWLEWRHFALAGTEERVRDARRARNRRLSAQYQLPAAQRTNTPHLDSLGIIAPPNWPDESKISAICESGGKMLTKVLSALLEDSGTKAAINETAQKIIDDALEKAHMQNDQTLAKRYLLGAARVDATERIETFLKMLASANTAHHALQVHHKHNVHLILDAWARTIVDTRIVLINNARGEYDQYLPSMAQQTGITWPVFQRAIEPLTNGLLKKRLTRIERDETYGKSADLHAARVLFGLCKVRPTGDGGGGDGGNPDDAWPLPFSGINDQAVKYARELRVVQRLMNAQQSIMMDAQLFRNGLPDYDPTSGEKYHILAFTAEAFKYIFVSVKKAHGTLNELLERLLNGTLDNDQLEELRTGLDATKRTYADVQTPDADPRESVLTLKEVEDGDVPDTLFESLQITQAVLDTYNPVQRYQVDKWAEDEADKLRLLNIWYTSKRSKAKAVQVNIDMKKRELRNIAGNGASYEERRKAIQSAIDKKNKELADLLVILKTVESAKIKDERYLLLRIGSIIKAVKAKARRKANPPKAKKSKNTAVRDESEDDDDVDERDMFTPGGPTIPSDDMMIDDIIDTQIRVGEDGDEEDAVADAIAAEDAVADALAAEEILEAAKAATQDQEADDEEIARIYLAEGGDIGEIAAKVQFKRDATNAKKHRVVAQEEPAMVTPPSPTSSPLSMPPSMPPSPPSDPVQLQMPTSILPPMTQKVPPFTGYVEKMVSDRSKVLTNKALDDAPQELIGFLDSKVAVLRAQYVKATRRLNALRSAQTKEKRAITWVRAHVLRGELDANASERRAELLAELNVGLRELSPQPGGFSYSQYLARLQGIGILDPEACNDSNTNEIDAYETHGWKGEYRLHVGRMLHVLPTGGTNGGPCYHLDALPPTPRQWLESEDVVYAPSAPLPLHFDASARADAAMLQATSLDWGVEDIVGPKDAWEGRLDARAKEEKDIRASLEALLQADRDRLLDDTRSPFAPWGFDFDMIAESDVVVQSE